MSGEPRILGVTLARGGSKGVPRKNLRPILGVPLIAYTIRAALRSERLARYIVSTDDPEIQRVTREYGAEAPFLRPADLASDQATSAAALEHAVRWAEAEERARYDFVVELMATNPLKTVADIDGVLEKMGRTGADSVVAVHMLEHFHPARVKKIVDDRLVDFCVPEVPESRRQDLKPDAYGRSGSVYAVRRDYLLTHGRRFGPEHCRPYVIPASRAVDIDTEADFILAEYMLATLQPEEA